MGGFDLASVEVEVVLGFWIYIGEGRGPPGIYTPRSKLLAFDVRHLSRMIVEKDVAYRCKLEWCIGGRNETCAVRYE